jgi:hypothetical protein
MVGLVLVLTAAVPAHPAAAQDLPPGFVDGIPVGGEAGPDETVDQPSPEAPTQGGDRSLTRAVTTKYFGRAPWQAIEAAATAQPRTCTVSDNGLLAMAVAPVFKEASAALTPATAPSPMTLSRYDEWTGVFSNDNNRDANYGLYAFRDPYTSYKRAFWHPGIGIWQYDSAGVGAPFTAIERMDVRLMAADVIAGMATRYCDPDPWLPESADEDGFSGEERRAAAWAPWGYPCTLCEAEFWDMVAAPAFSNIALVDGISVTGGAAARSCSLAGVSGTFACWYVNPSVGVIEGATGWATLDPSGASPTVAPTPLTRPFYVLERNGREERHFLAADTGYDTDISGSRELGKNARPRSNQTGSGITWVRGSGLCDLTSGRGTCVPTAPAGVNTTVLKVNGTYRPVALDADGDGRGDVLWYAPGTGSDSLWLGQGSGGFRSVAVRIDGTFDDVVPLDVDGNGREDLLWYARATGKAYLWVAAGAGAFVPVTLSAAAGMVPLVVDRDGDGADELFWYGRGNAPDAWARWNGGGFTLTPATIAGDYRPLAADFDGNGREDIFWYAPGSAPDRLWLHRVDGGTTGVAVTVNGTYNPLIGDFDGDGPADIFWYAPGSAPDSLWFGGRTFTTRSATVTTTYTPVVADLLGDGRDDIVWYQPGVGRDPWWTWNASRVLSGSEVDADGTHQPVVGAFSAGGADGVLWYAPGSTSDAIWWR